MFQDTLAQLGITPEETALYTYLLENGPQTATTLGRNTKVKRTYVYTVSRDLLKKGLIRQEKQGRTTYFHPQSPDKLLDLAESQKLAAAQARSSLENILPTLKSQYALSETKPVVSYFEGVEGIKKVYNDIILTKTDLILFRSFYDDKHPEIDALVNRQIKRQVEAGIHTRVISPLEKDSKNNYLHQNQAHLVDQHLIKSFDFKLASQILIYGNKTAIISLKKSIVTTLIDNPDITNSFKTIFEYMWQQSQTEHNQITQAWNKP